MSLIFNKFEDFLNEELTKLPTTYKYTKNETEDQKHNRLASKDKDGHSWKKTGTKKSGKESMEQNFSCKCGYKKKVMNDENKKVEVTYSKGK
jgi:hypothetical protein